MNIHVHICNMHVTDFYMHVTSVNMHVHICNMHVTDVNMHVDMQSTVRIGPIPFLRCAP